MSVMTSSAVFRCAALLLVSQLATLAGTTSPNNADHYQNVLEFFRNKLTEGGMYSDENVVRTRTDETAEQLQQWRHDYEITSWNYLTNLTEHNQALLDNMTVRFSQWQQEKLAQAQQYQPFMQLFKNKTLQRELDLMCSSVFPPDVHENALLQEESQISSSMESTYATSSVRLGGETMKVEPELETLMATSRDYDVLLEAWVGWRNATSVMRRNFTRLTQILNQGATENGFADRGVYWRESEFEMPVASFNEMIDDLWEQVQPLYQQLHTYVRRKLITQYPQARIRRDGPIPAHLLGNMWAQDWSNLVNITAPFSDVPTFDVTQEMLSQGYTVERMFRTAEEFFTSIGLEPMTDIFWEKSMLTKPEGREVECHGSAHDFYTQDDFRIKMCTEVTMTDLKTVHHEMGHIEYFMQYRNLSSIFREGANTAFHEAIGDTIALFVVTPDHLQKIGLLQQSDEEQEDQEREHDRDINFLMKIALEKIAFLPFALVVDKWRWDVFSGDITEANYNSKWWEYRYQYQGLVPPVERRDPQDFDPVSKYHVAASIPYIRYFLSFVTQFQFHKALCDEAGHKDLVHRCDIYQKPRAGNKLKEMLQRGRSRPWQRTMEEMTGIPRFDASALIDYFRPLYDHLQTENKREFIGWQ